VQGTKLEYEFMSYFTLKNGNTLIQPKNKEELQMALARLVKSELGSASTMVNSTEAQKAQAVVSYTYVLWYNANYQEPYGCSLKTIDLSNKWDKKIYDAVGDVVGVKLMDTTKTSIDDMVLQTTYSAATGGFSASSNRVWSGSLPYAKSVVSKYDDAATYSKYGGGGKFINTVTFTREELNSRVKDWFKKNVQNRYPTYVMPEEQFAFDPEKDTSPLRALSYDGDGTAGTGDGWNYVFHTNFYYVDNRGNKKPLTGFNMRSALGLRSHAFRVTYDAATDRVTLTTQGWGHGVGLSQMGAVGYANEEGWNYVKILRHYFSVTSKSAHQIVMPVW
jgi:stage II sporulation protein D